MLGTCENVLFSTILCLVAKKSASNDWCTIPGDLFPAGQKRSESLWVKMESRIREDVIQGRSESLRDRGYRGLKVVLTSVLRHLQDRFVFDCHQPPC